VDPPAAGQGQLANTKVSINMDPAAAGNVRIAVDPSAAGRGPLARAKAAWSFAALPFTWTTASARQLAEALVERLPEIDPKVIVNRFQQTLLFGTGLRRADLERALERFFAGTVANNYPLVREAIDRGLALDEVKAGSNVSADLRRLVVTSAQADLARAR
jgi:hypothetical protein